MMPSSAATTRTTMSVTDRKSTRLNSSHLVISYAVFCLKKKTPETWRNCGNSCAAPFATGCLPKVRPRGTNHHRHYPSGRTIGNLQLSRHQPYTVVSAHD